MSSHQTLEQFLTKKRFVVPKYQRSYAWERENIQELYEDIQEALDTDSTHYIGTVVLAKTDEPFVFHIVDGQQRLTSLVLLVNALIDRLSENDRDFYRRRYICEKKNYKLTPHARDTDFFQSIIEGRNDRQPESRGQRFLMEADDEIRNIVEQLVANPLLFLQAVENLSILEFVEENEGDAIRIFQTVNDRGKELSRMDKLKSVLFYFSNKYLGKGLDDKINDTFGDIFEAYDDIKQIAERERFPYLSTNKFSEDDLLRHHHICVSDTSYDPAAQHVLAEVKEQLVRFRQDGAKKQIRAFIRDYADGLREYALAFRRLMEKAATQERYFKLFGILGLSAPFYPVITQLERRKQLDEKLPNSKLTLLELIEIVDVRVLKIRAYQGKKHISELSLALSRGEKNLSALEDYLEWFNSFEIGDDRFKDWLKNRDYFKQTGLLRLIFVDYCERLTGNLFTLDELKSIMKENPTIEHILSQTNNFKPRSFGFTNNDQFREHMNLIGNLTLLEKRLNSSVGNADLKVKAQGYGKSRFKMTTRLGSRLSQNSMFSKKDLLARSEELANDLATRWRSKDSK